MKKNAHKKFRANRSNNAAVTVLQIYKQTDRQDYAHPILNPYTCIILYDHKGRAYQISY